MSRLPASIDYEKQEVVKDVPHSKTPQHLTSQALAPDDESKFDILIVY